MRANQLLFSSSDEEDLRADQLLLRGNQLLFSSSDEVDLRADQL